MTKSPSRATMRYAHRMNVITIYEVQDDMRTVCLWNGEGWTRCWPGMYLPPVSGKSLPPRIYTTENNARAALTRRSRMDEGGFMIKGDLEDGLLVLVKVRDDLFAVGRLPDGELCRRLERERGSSLHPNRPYAPGGLRRPATA